MEEINKLIKELKEDIDGTIWYGRNTEEIEDALTTLKKLEEAIEVMRSCGSEAEQLVCDHSKHTFFRVLNKERKCNGCGEIYEAN